MLNNIIKINGTPYVLSLQVIYELSFNENQCVATEVDRCDTVTYHSMNCSSHKGIDNNQLFFVDGLHNILKLWDYY